MFHKIARIVKNISFMFLSWQSERMQKNLHKKLGYNKKSSVDGCSVEISQEQKNKIEKVNQDVKAILKKCKNDPKLVCEYLAEHNIKVYCKKRINKLLDSIHEKEGFITERDGFNALVLNYITGNGFKFNSKTMILFEGEEPEIHLLINCLHKWYAMKEGLEGFDKKSQQLFRRYNFENIDKLMNKLSIPEIQSLRNAIQRNIQSIDFVTQYAKEHSGAKNALNKMQQNGGANI